MSFIYHILLLCIFPIVLKTLTIPHLLSWLIPVTTLICDMNTALFISDMGQYCVLVLIFGLDSLIGLREVNSVCNSIAQLIESAGAG